MPVPHYSILIVDDNPDDSAVFTRFLKNDRSATYSIATAQSAAEGLALCRELHPQALIVDYGLPDDTGLEFLAELVAEHGQHAFAVLMLTGAGDEAVAVKAMQLGAQDYLVKGRHLEQRLSIALISALEKVALQQQVDRQSRELQSSNQQLQQALAAQQASEQQLLLALQAARMATWDWDLTTQQVSWSAGLVEILGLPVDARGGKLDTFFNAIHVDDREMVRQRLEQALQSGTLASTEFRMFSPRDEIYWLAAHGYVQRDNQGQPLRLIGIAMDITERKQANDALRESEERYRALVTTTSDLIWHTNASGEMLFISPLWHRLTGQTESEMRGWGWAAAIHPDDSTRALEVWREALASRSMYENEFRVRARDGSYRRFQGRGVPILAADGSLREWIGYSSDITDRKQAEFDLRRSEAQFKALVENAPDIIARFDRDLRHVYVSPAVMQATGLTPESLIGKTNRELGMPSENCMLWDSKLQQAFETGSRTTFEFTFDAPDGRRFYESTVIPELADDGTFETVMSIVRDVTAYKRAEERLRFLAEAGAALATSLDEQTAFELLARLTVPRLADACTIDLVDERHTIRTVVVAHVEPELEEALREMRRRYPPTWGRSHPVAQVLQTGRSLIVDNIPQRMIQENMYDKHHLRLVQRLAPASFLMVPISSRGHVVGVIGLYTMHAPRFYSAEDRTLVEELARRAAVALDNARLYSEAQEALRERDAFLSIASHELKNPLTSLLGRAQLLQRRLGRMADGARAHDDAELIIGQARRISTLLSEMLDMSRLESGQFSVERAPLDLVELIGVLVNALQSSTTAHEFHVLTSGEPLIVSGDAVRLEQVLTNLLGNAIKYSPDGGTITIDMRADGNQAVIAISDSGLGIPAEALPQLFKRFYRVVRDGSQHISGSGIGLYVVKEIVTGHGGTIEVVSTVGSGSTFTVRLPLSTPDE